jgi:methyl-accepting chemotaxis protein
MRLSHFTLASKLWFFMGFITALLIFTLTFATQRSAAVQARADAAFFTQSDKTSLSMEWVGQVETQLTRIVATAATPDPAVDAIFKALIPATSAHITDIQKKIEATGLSTAEKTVFDRIAEERKVSLTSLVKVRELKAAGDQAAAAAELTTNLQPLVDKYVKSLKEFSEIQKTNYAELDADFRAERSFNNWLTRGLVACLLVLLMGGTLVLIRQIRQPLRDAISVAETIASGDLSVKVEVNRGDEFGEMMRAIAHMQERLVHLVSDVRRGTDGIANVSEEIAAGNHDLSQRTEQSAASLEETASSMQELTSNVKQSADSARQANQLAGSAAQVAQRGGQVVDQVVSTMNEINASSRKISDIISVIDGIAFQTNILALNAAVEAARAGEQGRGFAVVASEVRSLAGRSADAAKDIKTLINTSVEKVEGGSALVAQAGLTMTEIVTSVQRVTDIMGEITAAASEQSDGIAQVNAAITQLDQMTQQNAALVEESAAAASSMKDQAQRLASVVATFKLDSNVIPVPAKTTTVQRVTRAPTIRPMAAPARRAVPPVQAKLAVSSAASPSGKASAGQSDDDWETF